MFEFCDFFQFLGVSILIDGFDLLVFVVDLSYGVFQDSDVVILLGEISFEVLYFHLSLLEDGKLVLEFLDAHIFVD